MRRMIRDTRPHAPRPDTINSRRRYEIAIRICGMRVAVERSPVGGHYGRGVGGVVFVGTASAGDRLGVASGAGAGTGTCCNVSPTDVLVAECTLHSCIGSVPGRYHSVMTTGSGQYWFRSMPVVRSMSFETRPSGRGQSGGAGLRR